MLDGRLALDGCAGTLDDGRAPTRRTVFRIASMTKSFTAATVLALRDAGVVGLDDPIASIVPAQLMIEQMALRMGLDPDNPRGLNKVTQTEFTNERNTP